MLSELNITFEESDYIFNVLSIKQFWQEIGNKMHLKFVEERIKGSTYVWAKFKKRKLKTFQSGQV